MWNLYPCPVEDCFFLFFLRWCHDIGREQAANKPLLKTVFQVTLQKKNIIACSGSEGIIYPQEFFIYVGHDEVIQSSENNTFICYS
jgi:hypothetical protein